MIGRSAIVRPGGSPCSLLGVERADRRRVRQQHHRPLEAEEAQAERVAEAPPALLHEGDRRGQPARGLDRGGRARPGRELGHADSVAVRAGRPGRSAARWFRRRRSGATSASRRAEPRARAAARSPSRPSPSGAVHQRLRRSPRRRRRRPGRRTALVRGRGTVAAHVSVALCPAALTLNAAAPPRACDVRDGDSVLVGRGGLRHPDQAMSESSTDGAVLEGGVLGGGTAGSLRSRDPVICGGARRPARGDPRSRRAAFDADVPDDVVRPGVTVPVIRAVSPDPVDGLPTVDREVADRWKAIGDGGTAGA